MNLILKNNEERLKYNRIQVAKIPSGPVMHSGLVEKKVQYICP